MSSPHTRGDMRELLRGQPGQDRPDKVRGPRPHCRVGGEPEKEWGHDSVLSVAQSLFPRKQETLFPLERSGEGLPSPMYLLEGSCWVLTASIWLLQS